MSESVINTNDIFDELKDENNCLKSQLKLTDNCVNILLKITLYYEKCFNECKCFVKRNKSELNKYELQLENALKLRRIANKDKNKVLDNNCVNNANNAKDIEVINDLKDVNKSVVKRIDVKNNIKTKTRKPNINELNETKPEFQCDFENCGKSFIYAKALNSHKFRIHNIFINSINKNINFRKTKICYECTDCPFKTFNKQMSKDHKNIHTNQTPYQCEVSGCGKMFRFLSSLRNHKRYVHSKEDFICVWVGCDFKSKWKHQLEVHKMTHSGDKPFVCHWPGCDFKTAYGNKLKGHSYRHTGEKPHKCLWPACEWSFRERGHLATHMLKHTGVKPWKCQQCGQQFQTKQAMRFHCQRRHPQEFNVIPSAVTN